MTDKKRKVLAMCFRDNAWTLRIDHVSAAEEPFRSWKALEIKRLSLTTRRTDSGHSPGSCTGRLISALL